MAYKPRHRVRAFIALEVDDAIKSALRIEVKKLQRIETKIRVRWVDEDDQHLTVKFLGDIDILDVPKLVEAIQKDAAQIEPFEIEVQDLHAFPPGKSPRVVAAGLGGDLSPLVHLHDALNESMKPFGVPPEYRKYKGHLTLARIKGKEGALPLWEALEKREAECFGSLRAEELILFQSDLTPKGPTYTPLATIPIGKK